MNKQSLVKKKVSRECNFFLLKEEGFVEKCHGILTRQSYKLDVKMFSYFIVLFKDVQDSFSNLPV